jgi:hypothetical protein
MELEILFSLSIGVAILFAIEQVAIMAFSKYPYRLGIPLAKLDCSNYSINSCKSFKDQLRSIAESTPNDRFIIKVQTDTNEIFVRHKYKYFSFLGGLWLISGRLYFSGRWVYTIKLGIFTYVFLCYLFGIIYIMGSFPFVYIFIIVIFFIYVYTFEFYMLRKYIIYLLRL